MSNESYVLESSDNSSSDEEIQSEQIQERKVPTLKAICMKYVENNFNLLWKNRSQAKAIFSTIALDPDKESDLIKSVNQLNNLIINIENDRAALRNEKIANLENSLMKDRCFVRSISSTAAILETVGYVGISYGISNLAHVSADIMVTVYSLAPIVAFIGVCFSKNVITPSIAKKYATLFVDMQQRNQDELTKDEKKMLPPNIHVMRYR